MDDAINEGYKAYLSGVDETNNPYDLHENEEAHLSWNDGWAQGCEEDQ